MRTPHVLSPEPVAAGLHRRPALGSGRVRLFHNATRHDTDEAALQTWWRTLNDVVLNRFVEACLKQNAALSLASLRVTETCAGLPGALEDMASHPDCLKAWSLFHSLRISLVAATVRIYVDVLSLQERLLCTDLAIRHQSVLLQQGRGASSDRVSHTASAEQPTSLPELHLHRVRLQGERDAAVAGLAWLVGEPVDLVLSRIDGRLLPPAVSAMPASGTPDALLLRRPDLLETALQSASQENPDDYQARVNAVRCEQAFDQAVCEVERALAVLASAIGESGPARAAALAAGNRASALVQRMREGQPDYEAMLQASRLYHGYCDREIEVRARGYRALTGLYEALGAGWPAPIETGEAR